MMQLPNWFRFKQGCSFPHRALIKTTNGPGRVFLQQSRGQGSLEDRDTEKRDFAKNFKEDYSFNKYINIIAKSL